MQPSQLGELLGVTSQTIRRWSKDFKAFLSPGANPPKGNMRLYDTHDQRVLLLVTELRAAAQTQEQILERLEAERAANYEGLPQLPPGWGDETEITMGLAQARAGEIATIAVLQTQVQHLSSELQKAVERAERLQGDYQALQASHSATEAEKHALEVRMAQAQGEVEALRARLQGYTMGSERPISPVVLVLVALAAGAALMLIAFVVLRLAG